jgi:hypothetical protein
VENCVYFLLLSLIYLHVLIAFCRAKYPLAIVDKLLNVFQGRRIKCGYDIACAFWKTLMASSLGPKARERCFQMVVGSFYGHAHNRGCQVNWHPLYVKDIGHANFEGCERIFRFSNPLAPGTRHASKFRRQQAIEEHFAFWDEDKHAGLGLCLISDVLEALTVHPQVPFYLITIVKLSQ